MTTDTLIMETMIDTLAEQAERYLTDEMAIRGKCNVRKQVNDDGPTFSGNLFG